MTLGECNFNYSFGVPLMKHNTMWYVIQQTQCAWICKCHVSTFPQGNQYSAANIVFNVELVESILYRIYHIYEVQVPLVAGHVQPHWFATINSTWTSREERGETVAWHGPSAPGSRNDQRSRLNPLPTRIYDLKRIVRSPSIVWCSSVRLTF